MLFDQWRAEAARIAAGMYGVELDRVPKEYLWRLWRGDVFRLGSGPALPERRRRAGGPAPIGRLTDDYRAAPTIPCPSRPKMNRLSQSLRWQLTDFGGIVAKPTGQRSVCC
jgi:hypothetical protein